MKTKKQTFSFSNIPCEQIIFYNYYDFSSKIKCDAPLDKSVFRKEQ